MQRHHRGVGQRTREASNTIEVAAGATLTRRWTTEAWGNKRGAAVSRSAGELPGAECAAAVVHALCFSHAFIDREPVPMEAELLLGGVDEPRASGAPPAAGVAPAGTSMSVPGGMNAPFVTYSSSVWSFFGPRDGVGPTPVAPLGEIALLLMLHTCCIRVLQRSRWSWGAVT